jgi:hypothetical protein
LSRELFASAQSVVIGLADQPLEALAAAPLASALPSPLLLLGPSGVTSQIRHELRRLGATQATLVGPVPQSASEHLNALGIHTSWISRSRDPHRVAAAVAARMHRAGAVVAVAPQGPVARTTALAAAGFAAARRVPLLYANAKRLPASTRRALHTTTHVTVVAIDRTDARALASQIRARGISVTVVTGDRFHVSARLASMAAHGSGKPKQLVLTSGSSVQPSLAGAADAGASDGISLLVPAQGALGSTTKKFFSDDTGGVDRAWITGGENSVGPQIETQVEKLL